MYYLRDIGITYGDRILFDRISFMIGKKERIGLVGRNGAGKSTLLKVISGEIHPDEGKVEFPSKTSIGYLKQEFTLDENKTVIEETRTCFEEVNAIQDELDQIHQKIEENTDYESQAYTDLLQRMSDLSSQLELHEIGNLEARIVRVLNGLGFDERELNKYVNQLSGGWKMRILLAKLLLRKPDLLLLDEPTNHLDIESIIWLEQYLAEYPGIVILISHDTLFLNNICNRTLEIELGRLFDYKGNYNAYIKEKELQKSVTQSAYENQQKVIAQKERTITRFMAKASKTKMAQSMQKQLDKMQRIEIADEDTRAMNIRFAEVPRSGRDVVKAVNISKSFDDNNVLNKVNLTIERGDKVAFVGQNGQGKTTLAKILIDNITPSGGEVKRGSNLHLSYYAQNQSELLNPKQTLLETMEEKVPEHLRTKVRSVLGSFLFSGEDVDKKVSVLSGGERARLAMASLILFPCNFLVLDEPTNHLDRQSKNILKEALMAYKGTLLVVSHDRDFLSGLTDKVIGFKDGAISEYLGDINYYLEKRQMDDMRQVELEKSSTNQQIKAAPQKKERNHKEIKNLRRKIQYLERDIEKIENQLKEKEMLLADPDFYNTPDFVVENKNYLSLKEELENKMLEWEECAFKLEEAE